MIYYFTEANFWRTFDRRLGGIFQIWIDWNVTNSIFDCVHISLGTLLLTHDNHVVEDHEEADVVGEADDGDDDAENEIELDVCRSGSTGPTGVTTGWTLLAWLSKV